MAANAKMIKQYTALRSIPLNRVKDLREIAASARGSTSREKHVDFKGAFESLNIIISDFDKYHTKLLELVATGNEDADLDNFHEILKQFDVSVNFIRTCYIELFGDINNKTVGSLHTSSGKLPKITLPTFDGHWKSWPAFRDLFESLVHTQDTLDNIEKFQYLVMSLSGEPLTLVKSVPLEATNYSIAYETLKKRYQNRRLLATSYYTALTKLPRVTLETIHLLRHVLDNFSENINALYNLGLPTSQWDFVLFNMLSQKIDSTLIKRFEMQYDALDINNDIPTFKQLFEFLEKQCSALDTVSFTHPEKQGRKVHPHNFQSNRGSGVNLLAQETSDKGKNSCVFCKKAHNIFQCDLFEKKNPKERYELAKQKKLCLNCLGSFHKSLDCRSEFRCKICRYPHHTLLHFSTESSGQHQVKMEKKEDNSSLEGIPGHSGVKENQQVLASTVNTNQLVLLSTTLLKILDGNGDYKIVRALFDSGSQVNIISEKCRKWLNLPISEISLPIHGLGKNALHSTSLVNCNIKPVESDEP